MAAAAQPRLREKRRKRRAIVATLALIFVLLACYGVVTLMRERFLRIGTITIEGASTLATSTLETFARGELAGNFWYVFPKDNIWLYPKNKLEAGVRSAFPVVKSVGVRADTLTSISLVVSERRPRALWCGAGDSTASSTPSPCLLLDESGMAYGQSPQFSGFVYVPYYGVLLEDGIVLPAQFLSPDTFRSLSALVDSLVQQANQGIPDRVLIDENDDVHVRFGNGFTVLFALGGDSGEIAQRFVLALASAPFSSHPLSAFRYLDLRFGDKLYFKLK